MDYLCELPNDAARRAALASLPPDLNSTYERILSRVNQGNPQTQKVVRRALRWIANDEGSLNLTVEALCEAVSIDLGSTRRNPEAISDDSAILRGCSSLVRRSQDGDKLELAHFTVKEFLQQIDPERDPSIAAYQYNPWDDQLKLAKVCLTYLMFDNFDQSGSFNPQTSKLRFQEYPFREYAVLGLAQFNFDEEFSSDTEFSVLLQRLFNPSKPNTFISWAQDLIFSWGLDELRFDSEYRIDMIKSGLAEATPLHYAAILGLSKTCGWLIGNGCDVNRNTKFGTPLHCALLGGHSFFGRFSNAFEGLKSTSHELEIVELLLKTGADPNCYYRSDVETLSSLSVALYTGNLDIAVKLLDMGAIFDSNCLDVLEDATRFDVFSSQEISEIIGHITEDNIRQQDTTRLVELTLKSEASNATRLMQLSNDLPSQSLQYEQHLRTAAEYGQVEIVMNLLEAQKLDVNAADGDTGLTALHHAAKTDQLAVAQVLLDRGADLSRLDNRRRTALHHSVVSGETECLQFFLQKNPDNSDRDLEDMTACHLAAQEGNLEALSVLSTTHNKSASFTSLKADDGATALLYAAESGNVEAMTLLLSAGSDLTETDSDGCTSLHYASKSGSLEAVKFLAEKASLQDVVTHDGSTALHYAITGSPYKIAELLRILIENEVDPCRARNDEVTPLHMLVRMFKNEWSKYGDVAFHHVFAAGRTLLERMLENSRSTSVLRLGSELMYLACSHPFPRAHEIVLALLGYGLDPNIAFANGETALMAAARRGDDTTLNTLLLHWADPGKANGRSEALKVAIDIGSIELSTRIIRNGTNLVAGIDGCSRCTPLLYSLHKRQYAMAKHLISQGATTVGSTCDMWATHGYTAFHYAADRRDAELLQFLLQRSPSENHLERRPIHPMHPIHIAILRRNAECVKLLLDHNSEGKNSNPVVMLRCTHVTTIIGKGRTTYDQLGTLQEVLDRKVNVQVRSDGCGWYSSGDPFPIDNQALRPLDIAAILGHSQIGSTLLAHGASVGSLAGDHVTPLHYAAEKGQLNMVKVLLEAGANPNALDSNLQSPAMRAAEQGDLNCVRVLLEAGANIQLRDICGRTALHLAADSRAKDVFSFLMNKMSEYELITENMWGGSALYIAMCEPFYFPMSFLLSLAPSAAAYRSKKSNILNAAIRHRSTVEFKMLLRRIPAYRLLRLLNQRDLRRVTPLHTAAMHENLDIITLLLDTGAELEIEACDHGTALMGACAAGRLESVKFLVAKGARTSYMQDGKLYSALLAAKNYPEIRRWLLVGRFVEGPRLLAYKEV